MKHQKQDRIHKGKLSRCSVCLARLSQTPEGVEYVARLRKETAVQDKMRNRRGPNNAREA